MKQVDTELIDAAGRILNLLGAPRGAMAEYGPLGEVVVRTADCGVSIHPELLRRAPMDAIRAIYRGLNLNPSPYQIEAAWKSVAVPTRA